MPKRPSNGFDQLDYAIIKALQANSRIPAATIAHNLSENERTVRKRIDRLISSKALRLSAMIDSEVFGYIVIMDVFLETRPEFEDEVISRLLTFSEISYLAFGQGRVGISVISIETRFRSFEQMRQFLTHTLPSIPQLKVIGFAPISSVIRNQDEWLPDRDQFE